MGTVHNINSGICEISEWNLTSLGLWPLRLHYCQELLGLKLSVVQRIIVTFDGSGGWTTWFLFSVHVSCDFLSNIILSRRFWNPACCCYMISSVRRIHFHGLCTDVRCRPQYTNFGLTVKMPSVSKSARHKVH